MSRLSHINEAGDAVMVDVSDKAVTARTALAEGFVSMAPETLALVTTGEAKKGDVLAAARLAGTNSPGEWVSCCGFADHYQLCR